MLHSYYFLRQLGDLKENVFNLYELFLQPYLTI